MQIVLGQQRAPRPILQGDGIAARWRLEQPHTVEAILERCRCAERPGAAGELVGCAVGEARYGCAANFQVKDIAVACGVHGGCRGAIVVARELVRSRIEAVGGGDAVDVLRRDVADRIPCPRIAAIAARCARGRCDPVHGVIAECLAVGAGYAVGDGVEAAVVFVRIGEVENIARRRVIDAPRVSVTAVIAIRAGDAVAEGEAADGAEGVIGNRACDARCAAAVGRGANARDKPHAVAGVAGEGAGRIGDAAHPARAVVAGGCGESADAGNNPTLGGDEAAFFISEAVAARLVGDTCEASHSFAVAALVVGFGDVECAVGRISKGEVAVVNIPGEIDRLPAVQNFLRKVAVFVIGVFSSSARLASGVVLEML